MLRNKMVLTRKILQTRPLIELLSWSNGHTIPTHCHDTRCCFMVLTGRLVHRPALGNTLILKPREFVTMHAGEVHSLSAVGKTMSMHAYDKNGNSEQCWFDAMHLLQCGLFARG